MWPHFWGMLRDRWSIGSGASRRVDCRDCGRGNAPGDPVAWMRSDCEESMPLFARRPAIWDWLGLYGTARPWRPGLRESMGLTWECVSASVCSGSWAFGCASRAPALPKPILNGRRRIKKLQTLMQDETVDLWATDEVHFQQHGSRCQMWIPPETKDPVAARSHAAQRGILRRCALARREIPVLPGSRQIQWRDLLCVHEKSPPHQHPNRAPSGCHHRQREISSC